jgi:hypothetical protein
MTPKVAYIKAGCKARDVVAEVNAFKLIRNKISADY